MVKKLSIEELYSLNRINMGRAREFYLYEGRLLKKAQESCFMKRRISELTKVKISGMTTAEEIVFVDDDLYYLQEYLSNYRNLEIINYSRITSLEILKMFLSLFETEQRIHKEGIKIGDLSAGNIMRQGCEVRFVDFDYAGIRDIPVEVVPDVLNDVYNTEIISDLPDRYKLSDKIITLIIFLNMILGRRTTVHDVLPITKELENLGLPSDINTKLGDILYGLKVPDEDDYFQDEISYLVKKDYHSPYNRK